MKKNSIILRTYYAFLINGVVGIIFGAIMPTLLREYNLSYSMGGTMLSAHSIGNFLSSFLFGVMATNLGRKLSVILLSSMTALGFAGFSFLQIPVLFVLYCALTGIGRGAVSNISNTVISEVTGGNATYLNILHSVYGVGAFSAPFFISKALDKGYKLNSILLTVLVLTSLVVVVFSSMDLRKKVSEEVVEDNSFMFLKDKQFLTSCYMMFFYTGAEYAITGWLVTYLLDSGIMVETTAQLMLSVLWIVIIIGRLTAAYLSRTVNRDIIIVANSILLGIFYVLFLFSSNTSIIILIIVALGFSLAPIYPTVISTADKSIKTSQHAVGILLAMAGLGGIVFPFMIGFVAEKVGILGGMGFVAIAIFFLIIGAVYNIIHKRYVSNEN